MSENDVVDAFLKYDFLGLVGWYDKCYVQNATQNVGVAHGTGKVPLYSSVELCNSQ